MVNGPSRVVFMVGATFVAAAGAGFWAVDQLSDHSRQSRDDDTGAATGAGGIQLQRAIDHVDPLTPAFFVSDSTLLNENGGHAVRERRVEGPDDNGRAGVPYFIQFIDGRYAFGRTNDAGDAHTLFTDGWVAHRVFWDDQALARARDAVVNAPPDQTVTPLKPMHRWGDLKRAVAARAPDSRIPLPYGARVPTAARQRWSPVPCELPAPSSKGAPLPAGRAACSLAVGEDSPVGRACVAGGRPAAKKVMKCLVTNARARGDKHSCDECHQDLDDYTLTAGAVERFDKMLSAEIHATGFATGR